MAIKEKEEEETIQPLMAAEDGSANESSREDHPWMVYFSTAVAACGSYAFGTCVSLLVCLFFCFCFGFGVEIFCLGDRRVIHHQLSLL